MSALEKAADEARQGNVEFFRGMEQEELERLVKRKDEDGRFPCCALGVLICFVMV